MKNSFKNCLNKMLVFLLLLSLVLSMVSCAKDDSEQTEPKKFSTIDDLNKEDVTIVIDSDSYSGQVAKEYFDKAEIIVAKNNIDALEMVNKSKADAFIFDDTSLVRSLSTDTLSDLMIMDDSIADVEIGIGISKNTLDLKDEINSFVQKYKDNGVIDNLYQKYIVDGDYEMSDISKPMNPKRKVIIGTAGIVEPYTMIGDNGEPIGLDIELAKYMANKLNLDIEFQVMGFDALVAGLESNKLDLVISNFNITDERREIIDYSDPYMVAHVVACINKADYSDELVPFTNGKIAIRTGSIYDAVADEVCPDAEKLYFSSKADIIQALYDGKVDVILEDEQAALVEVAKLDKLKILKGTACPNDLAFILRLDNTELKAKIDDVIIGLKEDGTLDRLKEKWLINVSDDNRAERDPNNHGENGVLHVALNAETDCYNYVFDGTYQGYEIEVLYMVADALHMDLDIDNMQFPGVIPAVSSGKADLGVGSISVTDERKEQVLFSEPVYKSSCAFIVLADSEYDCIPTYLDGTAGENEDYVINTDDVITKGEENLSFFESLKASFDRTFIKENRWKMVVSGLLLTLLISIASVIIGTIAGFGFSFPLRSKNKAINKSCTALSHLLNGLPMVVILMIFYYIIFGKVDIEGALVSIICFSIIFANNVAGLINTGVMAVGVGQIEAAQALGYKKTQVFTKIVFPQAANQMFNQYKGAIVSLVKETAIVGYIAVEDLTRVSDIIRGRTYEAFFPLIATALIYFILTRILLVCLRSADNALTPRNRKNILKGVKTR